jgi:hypothetical protein
MPSPDEHPIWNVVGDSVRSSVDVASGEVRVKVGELESTVHLRCPRCGLVIFARPRWIASEHCPRCVARARKLVVLLTDSAQADRLILPVTRDGRGMRQTNTMTVIDNGAP